MVTLSVVPGLILQAIALGYCSFSLFTPRIKKEKTILIYAVCCMLIVSLCILLRDSTLWHSITGVAGFIVILAFLFKGKNVVKFGIYGLFFVNILLGEAITFLLAKYIYNIDLNSILNLSPSHFLWEYTAHFLIVVLDVLTVLFVKKKKLRIEQRTNHYILIYILTQCIFVLLFCNLIYEYKITSYSLPFSIAFVLTVSLVLSILICKTVKTGVIQKAETEQIKKEAKLLQIHYDEMRRQYESCKRMKHDFYNHVKTMESMQNRDKLLEYTKTLSDEFKNAKNVSFCDAPALDALLFVKKEEAEKKCVKLEMRVCALEGINVSVFDICTVVSNLLDNAIRAASETIEKSIVLEITRATNRLVITVKNTSLEVQSLKTTKQDKTEHGMGIAIVKDTTKKYNGAAIFKFADGIFESVASFTA